MTQKNVDPRILALCEKVTKKRARTVIDHILEHGHITTEDLQDRYGYDHPPRAARDVREEGVPLETFKLVSNRTGRKIAAYRFADPADIKRGRIGGRKAFSKAFKDALIERYGEFDALTAQPVESRYLQIDHRVPYEVAGDGEHDEENLDAYMLLDASSQRAKSWSCEHCRNWTELLEEDTCRACYWAFPESYTHVAMVEVRRVDLQWDGAEVAVYDRLAQEAKQEGVSVSALIKRKLQR
ncbi:HNH endonuclease [Pseudomonas paraeruginosa]|uniref:hypothetical protein n=1 Tax=Pseudomonas paraeruginosa TaxID=2994495 RepID=UPI0006B276EE|nr:hypothetical protein [Pseudomonas paraeruginosa]RQF85715.1 HNH endonuclease [Pseudomonas aeruginosa]KPD29653.1 HNH endonuclease [Pseudomonas paraeruginosa]KQB31284.1 HNH endonuclease [Pseudomonas paraeruginosa]MDT1025588.1 hypothetical protein [Pseudomonas paraeruginosa]PHJ32611.1 HNH endonuclease [Pseudomonas paraeruginosa]